LLFCLSFITASALPLLGYGWLFVRWQLKDLSGCFSVPKGKGIQQIIVHALHKPKYGRRKLEPRPEQIIQPLHWFDFSQQRNEFKIQVPHKNDVKDPGQSMPSLLQEFRYGILQQLVRQSREVNAQPCGFLLIRKRMLGDIVPDCLVKRMAERLGG